MSERCDVNHRAQATLRIAAISLLLISTGALFAQKKEKPEKDAKHSDATPVIWRDPGDISSLNMIYGIGGEADAPDPNAAYTFIEEDMNGTSPKVRVKDAHG